MRKKYKSLLFIILMMTLSTALLAQQTLPFNYQAVIRKADGTVVQNQQVTVTFTIQSASGAMYAEKHNSTTDAYGVINESVGNGAVVSGEFSTINWSQDLELVVAIDYDSDGADDLTGTSKINAVPKSGFAHTAAVADGLSYELADVATSGDFNDLQNKPNLSLNDKELGIDGGNTVDLSSILSEGAAQELSINGYMLSISNGNSISLAGADSDRQSLSLNGNQLSISRGNTVDLSGLQSASNTAGSHPATGSDGDTYYNTTDQT
ncbi:MAG: hypothetical protein MI892_20030, partial [Desulfobacterales bacterium]|nr:hypothetical protein [Desulfobacterales bacterium]